MNERAMRQIATLVAALALVLVSASSALASHSWGNYHWERSSNPLHLDLNDNVDSNYDGNLTLALSDWNKSNVLSLTRINELAQKNCGAVAGRVEVCNDAYGFRNGGWLGVATIWADGDHITKATVKLNDTFLVGSGPYASDDWRQMVTCQEVGHVFGLDHQDENFDNANLGTCMDYTSDPTGNLHPNTHDYDELAIIYQHLDGTSGSTGGSGPGNCNPNSPKCSGSIGHAPPFSRASRANGDVYVDHLANGLTRITHVFWGPRR